MKRLILLTAAIALFGMRAQAQTVTVNWASPQQTIDGFGAATFAFAQPISTAQADFFFTTTGSNIGLSLIRTVIQPNATDCAAYAAVTHPPGTCVTVSSGPTLFTGDLQTVQLAAARGSQILASAWSPASAIKSNGSYLTGSTIVGNSANYQAHANMLAAFPAFLIGQGLSAPVAIGLQNEPDINQNYPSALWTAQQIHDFIPFFSSALATAGHSQVKILTPEMSQWFFTLGSTTFNDAATAAQVGVIAGHGYGSQSAVPPSLSNITNQRVWMTEVSGTGNYNGSMGDALTWATLIHKDLAVANTNAWVWWFLSDQANQGNGADNSALTDFNGNIPLRAYATGNWSKFVRPGWQRVGVTNSGGLLVTAFKNPAGLQSAIVVVNTNSNPVTNQVFSVGTQMGPQVVPWVTSATQSLVAQSAVSVSGGNITYTIPGRSVVTFAAEPAVAPPTGLSVISIQ